MDPKNFHHPETGKVILARSGYWAFIPAPLPPQITWSPALVKALSDAERELSKLTTLAANLRFPKLLIQPFVRQEAVLSSRIEGTRASLMDLYAYESEQLSFIEAADDVREVHNYVRAMDYGLERLQTLPVSLRLIREIHAKLMENVRGGNLSPGEFRQTQNWIGPAGATLQTATFVPPPVEEMLIALDQLEKFIYAGSDIPALARVGMIHYQFEAIHPLLDGNGRVGRLLIVLILCEWGSLSQPLLNLSIYFERYRQEYYDRLLEVSQRGAWGDWLRFFLRGVSSQAQDGIQRLGKLEVLRMKYQAIAEAERQVKRMEQILDFLFMRPVLSIRQLEAELGVTYPVAKRYIEKLIQAGILKELTGHARNRIFRAEEIYKTLAEGEE
jgi:cell filamentation protein, protein adenylyltransferase